MEEIDEAIRLIKLVYSSDKCAGYTRIKKGNTFVYEDCNGVRITDEAVLKRLNGLVLPPAWTNIWICPKANGHLQATGLDVAGRKQYRYHSSWSKYRNDSKHGRMLSFGKMLPLIRRQVEKDLRKIKLSKEKVIAVAIKMLEETLIRVGNRSYSKLYGSFGLTTLRDRHIKINGHKVKISFKGKKGVPQEVEITQGRLTRMIKRLKDIPGQELFQYYEATGERRTIDSGCVNDYLRECTGTDFTAKDFRTWAGTVHSINFLSELEPFTSISEAKRNINMALDYTAKKLGNTRTVCKKYYVHPTLLCKYEEGKLWRYLNRIKRMKQKSSRLLTAEEKILLEFIKKEC